jgi:hypothetical protein
MQGSTADRLDFTDHFMAFLQIRARARHHGNGWLL